MKRSFVSLLTIAAISMSLISCNNAKKENATPEQQMEQEAVIAGEVSKNLLTAELKDEVTRFLKDMPDSDLPYKLSTGEVEISVANTDFMLPTSKANELNTPAQKARACGIYFADLNMLKAMKKPTTEVESAILKLTTDLNIPFAVEIMKESAPANASQEELNKFLKDQEDAYIYGNPGLVVKGDAVSAGLSDNMTKRLDILQEITADLAKYYPDMQVLGETIAPLKDMVVSVNEARASKDKIGAMRDTLLK